MEHNESRRSGRAISVLLVFSAWCAAPLWADQPRIEFNIPAGEASHTLHEFYIQSEVQILFLINAVSGVKTQPVSGQFKASEALAMMLKGTQLRFEFENDYSVLITPVNVVGAAKVPGAGKTGPRVARPDGTLAYATEMMITGSHIRGVLELIAPQQQVESDELKATPYANVQNAVRQLPISSPATQNELFGGTGNFNRGTALSLRGLGSGATLVLVNGRRQASAGFQGDFVDANNFPWSLVERIDVLPDGSSALYGSDAIAGVINVVLRDRIDGPETQARFGTAPGGAAEAVAAQMLGKTWDTGKWLLAYQYSRRTPLEASDRKYTADSDKRPFGGRNFSTPRSNPGNILDPATFGPLYAIPSGQDGRDLVPGDLMSGVTNYQNKFEQFDLLPDRELHHAYFTGSQRFGERFELFGEARVATGSATYRSGTAPNERVLMVPAANPFNPFDTPALVAYNFTDDLGPYVGDSHTKNASGTAGFRYDLGPSWRAELSTSYSRDELDFHAYNQPNDAAVAAALSNPDLLTSLNIFGDGSHTHPATLEAIRLYQHPQSVSELLTYDLVADGPLFTMPGGDVKAALGVEFREERFSRWGLTRNPQRVYRFDRNVAAGFSELNLPLIGHPTNPLAIPRLELSLAGRYVDYSDFGNTTSSKIALRWVPVDGLKLRGSWATSFKAPKLLDVYDTSQNLVVFQPLPDLLSASGQSPALIRAGSNPNLQEERGESWTAGIDLAPPLLPGLTVSATWYSVSYMNQVIQPGGVNLFEILNHEREWAAAIVRNPSRALVESLCNDPQLILISAEQCRASAPAAVVDIRLKNFAQTIARGVDFAVGQSFDTGLGRFELKLDGNYIVDVQRAFTSTSPSINIADTAQNPLALRLSGSTSWSRHTRNGSFVSALLKVRHDGSYRNPDSPVKSYVRSSTFVDLLLSYRTSGSQPVWGGTEIALMTANVFNTAPPFVDHDWGFDVFNAEPAGRVLSLYLQKGW